MYTVSYYVYTSYTRTHTHMQYYRKPLLARVTTSQPIISEQDINVIFCKVDELYDLHQELSALLEPSLENWSSKTCVNGFFVHLVSDFVERGEEEREGEAIRKLRRAGERERRERERESGIGRRSNERRRE